MNENFLSSVIAERPVLDLSILDELEMDRVNLHKIINWLRKIPKVKHASIYQVAQKYGYYP